ncbi:MAG: class I SAM-dependent rRNA methyltransferase [Flavobacteriales bacterium]|nr:class I SAM-dependent rRNA methyltransferase [Flavobacteriales bacterium]
MKALYLKKGKEQSILRYHHWIFSGALQPHEPLQEGELVKVYTHKKEFIAWGYFGSGSIAVKILSFEDTNNIHAYIQEKIKKALVVRKKLGLIHRKDTNCCRLIHGEGDGLPGLIVDLYDRHVVMQVHHTGIETFIQDIAKCLIDDYDVKPETVVLKIVDKKSQTKELKYLKGNSSECVIKENGIYFHVDWARGQKTGFFIDQRENRSLLKQYVAGKNVLNTFCYTGGFSLYAEKGGANEVYSVDYSEWAMEEVKKNYALNGLNTPSEQLICSDALDYLHQHCKKFDVIILDPPAFAKSLQSRHNAIQAYKRINKSAICQIKPGGIIFTFSCSQVVDTHMFRQAIYAAGIEARRTVRILHKLSQPADHPVNLFHPETEYLKGLVLMID